MFSLTDSGFQYNSCWLLNATLDLSLSHRVFSAESQEDEKHFSFHCTNSPYTLYSIVIVADTVCTYVKTIIVIILILMICSLRLILGCKSTLC